MNRFRLLLPAAVCAGLLLVLATGLPAQEDAAAAVGPSPAEVFQAELADQGLETAVARLREILADTTRIADQEGWQLFRTARRLEQEDQAAVAIALWEILAGYYPDEALPWSELAGHYLGTNQPALADSCLAEALAREPQNARLQWRRDNLAELGKIARVQAEAAGRYAPGQNTGRQGPYLGEQPPTDRPQIFANGLVNTPVNEFSLCFSPDGKEIYFSRTNVGVLVCRWQEDGWTAPEVCEFFPDSTLVDEPNISPDNRWIFFNARPTLHDPRVIHRTLRLGDGWGEPERLFPGMFATCSAAGRLYYTETGQRPDYGVIARRAPTAAGYGEPEILVGGMQSEAPDAHPCIAADESFLIFDSYRDQGGPCGIYAAWPRPDGTWSEAVCLNQAFGIPPWSGQPALSPDGKYLFYSMEGDMYWVNVERLPELEP